MLEQEWKLDYYIAPNGGIPYLKWFKALSDDKAQRIIDARLTRIRSGNFGACEPVGARIFELKIYYGPGYRVYFGKAANKIILLLLGGDKSTQAKDIQIAGRYWENHKEQRK